MSHANVYRHFTSKAALRDAVVERWLHKVSAPLAAIELLLAGLRAEYPAG